MKINEPNKPVKAEPKLEQAPTPPAPATIFQQATKPATTFSSLPRFDYTLWIPLIAVLISAVSETKTKVTWLRYPAIGLSLLVLLGGLIFLFGKFFKEGTRWTSRQRLGWLGLFVLASLTMLLGFFAPYTNDALRSPAKFPALSWWFNKVERNAFRRAPETTAEIRALHATPNGRLLWAAGNSGMILHSADGGRNWEAQNAGVTNRLNAVCFKDATRGFAVGDQTLLMTTNGGREWQHTVWMNFNLKELMKGRAIEFRQIAFGSADYGLVVGKGGVNLLTSDGGQSWLNLADIKGIDDTLRTNEFSSVAFVSATNVWAATASGGLYNFTLEKDGASLTRNKFPSPPFAIKKLLPWNETNLLALSTNGSLWILAAKWEEWPLPEPSSLKQPTSISAALSDVATDGGARVWGVSTQPVSSFEEFQQSIFQPLFPPGTKWQPSSDLRQNSILTPRTANSEHLYWAGGTKLFSARGLRIVGTTDGWNWSELALPHQSYPPRFFWMLTAACAAASCSMLLLFKPERVSKTTKPDYAVSDAAVESLKDDKLDFAGLALGLARFLRNPNTVPPLTMAVTGDWGSGKSSILNMISSNLVKHSFPVVRFNAWHQQNEEQIFGALLKNVVSQGVPSIWDRSGVEFRARLYRKRIRKRWGMAVLWAVLLGGLAWPAISYLRRDLTPEKPVVPNAVTNETATSHLIVKPISTNAATDVTSLLREGVTLDWQDKPKPAQEKDDSAIANAVINYLKGYGSWPQWITWFVVTLVTAWQFLGRLKAFGLDPAKVLAKAKDGTRLADLETKASFQLRFADQFKEVTEAMGQKQLTIFIDDLDRCQPEKVAQMLEAINFLVASGKCFIVLGFSRLQVEAAVGLGFAPLAAEMDLASEQWRQENERRAAGQQPLLAKLDEAALQRANRRFYARLYLKKLINLEVAVPKAADRHLVDMLTNAPAPVLKPVSSNQNALASISPAKNITLAILLSLLTFFPIIPNAHAEKPDPKQSPAQQKLPPEPKTQPAAATPPKSSAPTSFHWWWALVPSFVVVSLCVRSFRQRPLEDALDPLELRMALDIWLPWVRPEFQSPRELKRYLNLIRYLVMRGSSELPDSSLPKEFGGIILKAEDVVFLSANYLRPAPAKDTADGKIWIQLCEEHLQRFDREPDPQAKAVFGWLSRDVQMR